MLSPDKMREMIEERKAQIRLAIRQLEANLAANQGALQVCDELLAAMDGSESEEEEKEGEET